MSGQTPNQGVNLEAFVNMVEQTAGEYEAAINKLHDSAESTAFNITKATVATTEIQVNQSLTEMAAGIAKNAADHTKNLGRKIGG
ncbi:MAG: hypothetical protein ACON35_04270 [Candidatus Marinamargulisbacteria bacterium]